MESVFVPLTGKWGRNVFLIYREMDSGGVRE